MTVYWTVWDAAAQWVVDRLVAEGELPSVQRLRERGCSGPARPARPNCQTPPSLATLFTGTWPEEHAVTGFDVPGAGHDGIAGELRGFDPTFPAVEPIWRTLGRHGRRAAFVHVPWVFDAESRVGPFVEAAVEAYSGRLARPDALTVPVGATCSWAIGTAPVTVSRPRGSADLHVTVSGAEVAMQDDGQWRPVQLGAGDDAPRTLLRHLSDGDRSILVHTGAWMVRTAGTNAALCRTMRDGPVFAGEAIGKLYRSGVFGPTLADGGDGHAEEMLLSSVRCVTDAFGEAADVVLKGHSADLVVIYLPMTDDIGHALAGWCDPLSTTYRPDTAERIWPYLRQVYRWADDILGRVLDRAAKDDTVVLGADHGIVGNSHEVHLNDALIQAGLAEANGDGEVDCARSPVFYHLANNGSLWLNVEHPEAGRPEFKDRLHHALAVLMSITDPGTGRPVVSGFIDARGARIDSAASSLPAVVYVVLHDDYQPTEELSGNGRLISPARKSAAHVVNTGDPRLHAIFAAAGPGIPEALRLPVLDNTDPAALVLAQCGLTDPPRHLIQEAQG